MTHRRKGRERLPSHTARWRVGAGEFRMRSFKRLQCLEQPVILGVGHKRRVEDVIVMVELFDFRAQFAGTLLNRHPEPLGKNS